MKNELIKVTYEEEKALVSARELHEFLEVKSRFNDWIKNRINKYELEENIDYTKILVQCIRGQNEYDYVLLLDTAKELSMVENNEKGKQARKYFIQCEKKLKEVVNKPVLPQDYLSALKALVASEEEKALMKPKVEYYESTLRPDTYVKLLTSSEVAKDLGISAQKLHTRLNELGVIYKQNKTWMLYSKYQDRVPEYCDYTINEHSQTLKWTEKGREWIIGLLKES